MSHQQPLQRPWSPSGSADEATYTNNVRGGVADSNPGSAHAKNLLDRFGDIYDRISDCSIAYGHGALPAKPATLHGRIDMIIQFGQFLLTHNAGVPVANVPAHNNAVRQVLDLLQQCIQEANSFLDYLKTSRDHVAAIVSTFD